MDILISTHSYIIEHDNLRHTVGAHLITVEQVAYQAVPVVLLPRAQLAVLVLAVYAALNMDIFILYSLVSMYIDKNVHIAEVLPIIAALGVNLVAPPPSPDPLQQLPAQHLPRLDPLILDHGPEVPLKQFVSN